MTKPTPSGRLPPTELWVPVLLLFLLLQRVALTTPFVGLYKNCICNHRVAPFGIEVLPTYFVFGPFSKPKCHRRMGNCNAIFTSPFYCSLS